MKIGGCDSLDSICYGHWKKMAEELSVGLAQLLRRIREFCQSTQATSVNQLSLPEECAPILAILHERAQRIEKTTNK